MSYLPPGFRDKWMKVLDEWDTIIHKNETPSDTHPDEVYFVGYISNCGSILTWEYQNIFCWSSTYNIELIKWVINNPIDIRYPIDNTQGKINSWKYIILWKKYRHYMQKLLLNNLICYLTASIILPNFDLIYIYKQQNIFMFNLSA